MAITCKDFNNRRAQRGAQLYDAFMAMRYDRKKADELGIDWKLVCRMGEMFRAEDQAAGRSKSWRKSCDFMHENSAKINGRRGVA